MEFQKFLARMDKSVPETHDVHRILDNDGTHKTARTHHWRRPRYPLHPSPASAAWLDQIEGWFAEITQQRIWRGTSRSTQALEAAIQEYLRVYNEDPQPFVWTKTADDTLNSLKSYFEGIAGGAH